MRAGGLGPGKVKEPKEAQKGTRSPRRLRKARGGSDFRAKPLMAESEGARRGAGTGPEARCPAPAASCVLRAQRPEAPRLGGPRIPVDLVEHRASPGAPLAGRCRATRRVGKPAEPQPWPWQASLGRPGPRARLPPLRRAAGFAGSAPPPRLGSRPPTVSLRCRKAEAEGAPGSRGGALGEYTGEDTWACGAVG
ncbi:hypothetical protein P7K49_007412 [Saguinus oedipus]|uniref:Uncharacterized protein n=1 Tax=Saguinus oedipus TaxID=9490 RepID=A0ABQ9VUS6_SAGOE|nr:hypothetical protein P7K49_007412 [Saguinus oedipus]